MANIYLNPRHQAVKQLICRHTRPSMDANADHELGPSPYTLLEAHQVVVDSSQASAETTMHMTSLSAENESKTSSKNSILEVGDLVTVSERCVLIYRPPNFI